MALERLGYHKIIDIYSKIQIGFFLRPMMTGVTEFINYIY